MAVLPHLHFGAKEDIGEGNFSKDWETFRWCRDGKFINKLYREKRKLHLTAEPMNHRC